MAVIAEYIWIDAGRGVDDPMSRMRSKTRVYPNGMPSDPADLEWDYDGSSTEQSSGSNADLPIKPVCIVQDPFRKGRHKLVLCEVMNQDGTPHRDNHRASLEALTRSDEVRQADPWLGFEQEYMLMAKEGYPLGFINGTAPGQGKYYCGVGAKEVFGLWIYGTNAEVCPGQWEFQIGPRIGCDLDILVRESPALTITDHVWLARYLLHRVGEKHGVDVSLHVKPVPHGDWNGSGMHTNFSSAAMRSEGGLGAIEAALPKLEAKHDEHIEVYGHDLHMRLTGKHETAPIDEFAAGNSDRGASIRIPNRVVRNGRGYFEDRRPGSSADPYQVAARLINTVLC